MELSPPPIPSSLPFIPSPPRRLLCRKSIRWAFPLSCQLTTPATKQPRTPITSSKDTKSSPDTSFSAINSPPAHGAQPSILKSLQSVHDLPVVSDEGWTLVTYKKRRKPSFPPSTKPTHPWFDPSLRGKPHLQRCFRCGIKGHRVSSCTNKMACLYCQLDDHSAAACPFLDPTPSPPLHRNHSPSPPTATRHLAPPLLPAPRFSSASTRTHRAPATRHNHSSQSFSRHRLFSHSSNQNSHRPRQTRNSSPPSPRGHSGFGRSPSSRHRSRSRSARRHPPPSGPTSSNPVLPTHPPSPSPPSQQLPSPSTTMQAATIAQNRAPSPHIRSIFLSNPPQVAPAQSSAILASNSMETHYHEARRLAFLSVTIGNPTRADLTASLHSLWPHWQWSWEAKPLSRTKFLVKFPPHVDLDAICAVSRYSLTNFTFSLRRWSAEMGAVGRRLKARAWIKISDVPIHCNNESSLRAIVRHFGAYHRRSASADEVIGPEEAVLLVDHGGHSLLPRLMNLLIGSLCYVLTISFVEELPYVPLSTASLLKVDLIPEPRHELLNQPPASIQPPQHPATSLHSRKGKEKAAPGKSLPTSRKLHFRPEPSAPAVLPALSSTISPSSPSSPIDVTPSSHVAGLTLEIPTNSVSASLPQSPHFDAPCCADTATRAPSQSNNSLLQLKSLSYEDKPESALQKTLLLHNNVIISGNPTPTRKVNLNCMGNCILSWNSLSYQATTSLSSPHFFSPKDGSHNSLSSLLGSAGLVGPFPYSRSQPLPLDLQPNLPAETQPIFSVGHPNNILDPHAATFTRPASSAYPHTPALLPPSPSNFSLPDDALSQSPPSSKPLPLNPSSSATHSPLSQAPCNTIPSVEGVIIHSPLSPMGSLDAVDYGTSEDENLDFGVVDIAADSFTPTPINPALTHDLDLIEDSSPHVPAINLHSSSPVDSPLPESFLSAPVSPRSLSKRPTAPPLPTTDQPIVIQSASEASSPTHVSETHCSLLRRSARINRGSSSASSTADRISARARK